MLTRLTYSSRTVLKFPKRGQIVTRPIGTTSRNQLRRGGWALALYVFAALAEPALAKKNLVVGGAEMLPDKDVVENLEKSADHTEFVTRIKVAHLVDTLKGTGPYTVFAPVNVAFANLPTMDGDALVRLLTHQVVPGNYTSKTLRKMLKKGTATISLKSMAGDVVTITAQGGKLMFQGATVIQADIKQKNGTLHVVDALAVHQSR